MPPPPPARSPPAPAGRCPPCRTAGRRGRVYARRSAGREAAGAPPRAPGGSGAAAPPPAVPRLVPCPCPFLGSAAAPSSLPLSGRPWRPRARPVIRCRRAVTSSGRAALAPEEEEGGRGRVNAGFDLSDDFRGLAHPPADRHGRPLTPSPRRPSPASCSEGDTAKRADARGRFFTRPSHLHPARRARGDGRTSPAPCPHRGLEGSRGSGKAGGAGPRRHPTLPASPLPSPPGAAGRLASPPGRRGIPAPWFPPLRVPRRVPGRGDPSPQGSGGDAAPQPRPSLQPPDPSSLRFCEEQVN